MKKLIMSMGWLAVAALVTSCQTVKQAPVAEGPFQPSWDSLKHYQCPEWFQDAKFGLWAHWTAQCVPEQGDWYARRMYETGSADYKYHVANYGHPSKFGFKDVDNLWKAEKWDPEKLMDLYVRAGAKYFVALANHHDNLDCYDSKYQPWNTLNVGPKKDIVGTWAKVAREHGLRFGVTVHAAHAWSWFEPAQGADKDGPLRGVPYDGKLTKADGKGLWWEGLDPQDLYAQNHTPGKKLVWDWDASKGSSVPDKAYSEKLFNRTIDLIDKYQPDLLYFDDHVLPLYPVSDIGLRIAAHYYNANMQWHGGRNEAVLNGKVLSEEQRRCMVWDIERGQSDRIEPFVWQTDTCIGQWHYNRKTFVEHKYKKPATVITMLVDIVSKNGNLLLNVPVKGDGTIDADEVACLEGVAKWMAVNSECIYGTRPWKVSGEGAALKSAAPIKAQGFNEGKNKPYTAEDIRFTTKAGALYATCLAVPKAAVRIQSLGTDAKLAGQAVAAVQLLGSTAKLDWKQEPGALVIQLPPALPSDYATVFKVTFAK